MKQRYDLQAVEISKVDAGDKMKLYNPQRKKGPSPKLSSHWEWPYVMVAKLSGVTYRIAKLNCGKPKVVRVGRLWVYHGAGNFQCSSTKLWTGSYPKHNTMSAISSMAVGPRYRIILLKQHELRGKCRRTG